MNNLYNSFGIFLTVGEGNGGGECDEDCYSFGGSGRDVV